MEEKIEKTKNVEVEGENKAKKKSKKTNIITKLLIALIIVVVVLGVIELTTGGVSKTVNKAKYALLRVMGKSESVGNTVANIRNFGYEVTDGKYLYYMAPSADASTIGIYKVSLDDLTGDKELLTEGVFEVLSLNYMDGYLYFITMASPEDEDSEDTVDNKICKMTITGEDLTVINDNEFNNDCYEIYVVDNKVYYIGENECIYYMDLDGDNKTQLNDDGFGYMGVTEDYIFFTNVEEVESEDSEEATTQNVTYVMNLDGTNKHAILEGQYLYNISVVGDYVYYQTENGYPSKVKIDGTDNTMISDEVAYSMVVCEEGIFYYNYYTVDGTTAGIALYKMDLDGSNKTLLTKLEGYSEFLCEFDNWIFFSDFGEEEGRFEVISKDGNQTIVLYRLAFSDEEETEDSDETDETSDTENANIEVLDQTVGEDLDENTIIISE